MSLFERRGCGSRRLRFSQRRSGDDLFGGKRALAHRKVVPLKAHV